MLTLLLATALAAPPQHVFDGHISAALEAGEIDDSEALWLSYLQIFEPDELPERYREEHYGWLCGTGVVAQLKERWHELTPAQRDRVSGVLTPWQDSLLDDMVEKPPPPPMDDICWSPEGANIHKSDHFQVEWDGGFSQSQADAFARSLEKSYDDELAAGWKRPLGMNAYLMQVYVSNENYPGAYTTVALCGGYYMPYIVAGRGSFQAGTWYQIMAAHEFNHASQYSYGFGHQFWFWEATATYVEELVYPNHNDWANQVAGFAANPQLGMHASSQDDYDIFNHMYGMGIWLFYLDEHVAGPEFVLEMWEYSETNGTQYDLWQDDVLEDLGIDFQETYNGFIVNNTVMDYREQDLFPSIWVVDESNDYPDDGQILNEDAPQSRGQSYVKLSNNDETDLPDLPDVVVEFDGDWEGEWVAFLAGTTEGRVIETVQFELDAESDGSARLDNIDDFDDIWIVASPMYAEEIDRSTDTRFEWDWSAELVPELVGASPGACGCRSTGGSAGWAALLISAVLLRRRR